MSLVPDSLLYQLAKKKNRNSHCKNVGATMWKWEKNDDENCRLKKCRIKKSWWLNEANEDARRLNSVVSIRTCSTCIFGARGCASFWRTSRRKRSRNEHQKKSRSKWDIEEYTRRAKRHTYIRVISFSRGCPATGFLLLSRIAVK